MELSPRLHNTLSYSVAALVLLALTPLEKTGAMLPVCLWLLHFARRSVESLFVHRYSGRKVPPADFVIEYIYYWGFAAWIAHGLAAPAWALPDSPLLFVALALFFVGEGGNAWAHLKLRALREQSGEAQHRLPQGGAFELVSCPHYFFEITTWVGFALLTQVWGAYAFVAVGASILSFYAWSRHRAYQEEFDGQEGRTLYPVNRRALFPFVF